MLDINIIVNNPDYAKRLTYYFKLICEQLDMACTIQFIPINNTLCFNEIRCLSTDNSLYILGLSRRFHKQAIELAKIIRQRDLIGHIIFLVEDCFDLKILSNQLLSPYLVISKQDLFSLKLSLAELIGWVVKSFKNVDDPNNHFFIFRNGEGKHYIPIEKIKYFESVYDHRIQLLTDNFKFEFLGSLTEIQREWPSFIRCHRSFLVNPSKILSFSLSDQQVQLVDRSTKVQIGKKYQKNLLEWQDVMN